MSAQALIDCINLFASQHSNPVLSVLPDNGVVEFKQKYPKPTLSFSGIGLRAYYHCHTSSSRPDAEHGHFHIFLKTDKNQWSHLAGLSMDNLGQPLQWFTVNHWVTGETWNNADQLINSMGCLLKKEPQQCELVEDWLLAMLDFYKQTLKEILIERDQQIKLLAQEQKIDAVLKSRSIYVLSQKTINLLDNLKSHPDSYNESQYNMQQNDPANLRQRKRPTHNR